MATLLIVDDDPTLLDVLSELFSVEHVCHTALTTEEALDRLSSEEYDVVVTDISMPGMSGETLLGFVKAHCPDTPVIIISGVIDRKWAERLKVKGAFDFLQKPFEPLKVYEKVALALKHRGRRQGRA
jgi:two-component system response regulator AtoC